MVLNQKNKFINFIGRRIKETCKRDNRSSLMMVVVAFMIANAVAIITAIGIPTGTTIGRRILDILLAVGLNALAFALFLGLFSIILSFLFVPLPRLLTSAFIYNGVLHGLVLHKANAGLSFSIFIGIVTSVFTIVLGLFIIYLLKSKVLITSFASLMFISAVVFLAVKLSPGSVVDVSTYDQKHPAHYGDYASSFFTYGSGSDLHRDEYGDKVSETSLPVDASHFITQWSDKRAAFWGFQPDNFPINGRVWMPDGEGKYPLILMVHGNHTMEYLSTAGYDYLGEMLASHGFIFISVDQDYVNYSNHLGQPNDNYKLRTWLLLQHLTQLQDLNKDQASQLYEKIDFNRVALAGHSRGGQAAAMAADYESFFDEADLVDQLKDVNIKAVAAISPTDKLIDNKRASLEDVAYMVLHGSADSDVYDFRGNKQFHRTDFNERSDLFKLAVYIENANHVHFNTSWGTNDLSFPRGIFLNRLSLIDKFDQQLLAQTYFTAFFKKVFAGDRGHDLLFQDVTSYQDFLPETGIISQYRPSSYKTIRGYSREDEVVGILDGFTSSEVIRPKGRSGNDHVKDVLELTWKNEAHYKLPLKKENLKNMQARDAKALVLTLANTPESTDLDIDVTISTNKRQTINHRYSITEAIEINNTVFGLFDGIFRDGKYEDSWEPIFQTIEIPLEGFEADHDENIDLEIYFYGDEGRVMLEEVGVY